MSRTHFQRSALRQLAGINDQLIYTIFVDEEFRLRLETMPEKDLQMFIPEAFPANRLSPRLNVQVGWIPPIQAAMSSLTMGAFFSAGYETVISHQEDALRFLFAVNGLDTVLDSELPIEQVFSAVLE